MYKLQEMSSKDSLTSIRSTNFRIPPLQQGRQLWETTQKNTNIRYSMSQTDANFISHQARLAMQQTTLKKDSKQPSKTELQSKLTISSIKYKSGRGRAAQYFFPGETYCMEKEEHYHNVVIPQAERHMKMLKQLKKQEDKKLHQRLLRENGPAWYQEPSLKQKALAEEISDTIICDTKMKSTYETRNLLLRMGITPLPSPKLVKKAMNFAAGDAIQFLLALYRLMNPAVKNYDAKQYSISDRIILSCMTHLALPSTLREMHIRIPSPPSPPKKQPPKPPKPKSKKKYESPYLEPLMFKPEPRKILKTAFITYPTSPYFEYIKDLKRPGEELPEKSEYENKYRIERLDQLIANENVSTYQGTVHSSLKSFDTSGDSQDETSSVKRNEFYSKSKLVGRSKLTIASRLKRSAKKYRRRDAKYLKSDTYTYHPIDDFDRQRPHLIIGGSRMMHANKPAIPIIDGISKMDYNKPEINYVINGVAISPDGMPILMINNVCYERKKEYSTVVHGGVSCDGEGNKVKVVAGISSKEVSSEYDIKNNEKPEVVVPAPYCQCTALYDEYVRLKELEHQKCFNVYRQYVVTKAKKAIKANPEVTYVVGGVTETDKGPVYILNGVQHPRNPNYEQVVGGISIKDDQPILIISGIQATRLYTEYLDTIKQTIEKMEETSIIVNGVTTLPDGTPKFIVSGVTIMNPKKDINVELEGVHYKDKNAVVVTDNLVKNPFLKDKFTTVISGITPANDGQPIHIIQNMQKVGVEEPKYTYVLEGVKPTQSEPLFIVSGTRGGEVIDDAFTPKCDYLIGGLKKMPDNRKVLVVEGLVLNRDEIPQPCEYVIAGVKPLPDGTTVNIIQQTIPRRPIDCECLDLYRKYMDLQEAKHKKCMDLYRRYLRKIEREEKEAFKKRMRAKDPTYIIGGIEKSVNGDPRFIITGLAAHKIVESFDPKPEYEMTQPVHTVIGGMKANKDGTSTMIIQGHTEHLAGKRPFVVIGGIKDIEGTPTYQITGVQAVPSVTGSICEFKKKKLTEHRESIMVVGGINQKPDGTATFTIDGVTSYPVWKEEEEESQKDFVCKCMRIYKRWLELELTEYDEEIIDGVGRRVDDIIVPFIDTIPTKPLMPKTIELLKMPRKYYKISCDYKTQMVLLK
ncbi:uncharacterized protein LOC123294905 isoform X2 [Chrysoperla carnea]|nr:uncharacterized protein LOC123294905 isoform X2 [Chrysoperla carnea]